LLATNAAPPAPLPESSPLAGEMMRNSPIKADQRQGVIPSRGKFAITRQNLRKST
jgi:hypothetical protein